MKNIKFKIKILFLGLGGAGQRHLRLLNTLFKKELFKIYAYRFKKKTTFLNANFKPVKKNFQREYNLEILNSFRETILVNPNIIFICTPSSIRFSLIKKFNKPDTIFCIEKPLAINLKELIKIKKHIKKNNQKIIVLFQRRYHEHNVLTLKKIKKIGKILFVKFKTNSYLPNWHKYENFRKLYAANKKLGGGVLLTECHEIDLCILFFGCPDSYSVISSKRKKFKLDVNDQAKVLLAYKNFNVLIELDFLNKRLERTYNIFGSKGLISSNQITNTYFFHNYKTSKIFKKNFYLNKGNDILFEKQLKYIFDCIIKNKKSKIINDFKSSEIICRIAK